MNIEKRVQMACEYIISDEGFWGEYSDISQDDLEDFISEAENRATEIANETKNIQDDEKAWEYIVNKLEEYKKELKEQLDLLKD